MNVFFMSNPHAMISFAFSYASLIGGRDGVKVRVRGVSAVTQFRASVNPSQAEVASREQQNQFKITVESLIIIERHRSAQQRMGRSG
jgi:hypothetical protein